MKREREKTVTLKGGILLLLDIGGRRGEGIDERVVYSKDEVLDFTRTG